MTKLMKIKSLKNYGIPSHILNIWEKHPSPYLLPIQEEAVRNYGILDCDEGSMRLPRRFALRNDRQDAVLRGNILFFIFDKGIGKSCFFGRKVFSCQFLN